MGQGSTEQVIIAPTAIEPDDEGMDAEVTEDMEEDVEEIMECVICFTNPIGAKMMPCGHAHFCL